MHDLEPEARKQAVANLEAVEIEVVALLDAVDAVDDVVAVHVQQLRHGRRSALGHQVAVQELDIADIPVMLALADQVENRVVDAVLEKGVVLLAVVAAIEPEGLAELVDARPLAKLNSRAFYARLVALHDVYLLEQKRHLADRRTITGNHSRASVLLAEALEVV